MPVFGFNSGKYDVNLIKKYLLPFLTENEPIKYLVKRNNNYMSINTKHLSFLDVTNFLAPGFSYDQFIRAYDCSMNKGIFPYEWIHLNNLEQTSLPPREAFDSTLKGSTLTESDYAFCQDVWKREGMKNMRDYLVWYNNLDVKPFVEAVEKMAQTYRDKGVDLFKDGISVPGLTLTYIFSTSVQMQILLFLVITIVICMKPTETTWWVGLLLCLHDIMKRVKRGYVVVNCAKRYKVMTLMHCISGL